MNISQPSNIRNTIKPFQAFSSRVELSVSPRAEQYTYNQNLHHINKFHYENFFVKGALSTVQVSFRFRTIDFSKKRALPFFLALELLTQRKSVATVSQRNVQAWKLRKGRLVGCKVTLRSESLFAFIDSLSLTLPRREKFQPSRPQKLIELYNYFSKKGTTQTSVRYVKQHKVQTNYALTLGELVLFYPIEVGLGLHPDVQRVQVQFIFSSLSVEEQYYFLRISKVPLNCGA